MFTQQLRKVLTVLPIVAIIALAGCSKQESTSASGVTNGVISNKSDLSTRQQRKVEQLVSNMPDIGVLSEDRSTLYRFNLNTREFSFGAPNDGWNFSTNDGPVFIPAEEGGGILIIPAFSFGGNTGGTVVAGSSALDINYTFCFSASDEALGLDLFDYGGTFDGISMVLGIAGDFDALIEGDVDEDSDFTDFFQGYAFYFVYDNEAQGTYSILNWFDDLEEDLDDLEGHGFSYVIDFVNFNLYFSSEGTLNVSGGEMSFTGEYFGILELLESLDDEDVDFDFVPGFGTMGCS